MANRFFDLWSRFYDQPLVQGAVYRPVHDAVVAAVASAGPTSILDVGCGTGLLTTRLATSIPGARVIGCEPSDGMVQRAADRPEPVTWLRGAGERLPIRAGSVDAVVSTDSFHWIPDQAAALAEFARVLRPGGRVFIAVLTSPTTAASEATSGASQVVGQPLYWPTAGHLRRQAEDAGFTVERQDWVRRAVPTFPFLTRLTVARAG
jgi:ubiquinone/menaquinone biosynthesis C-methylase UbiE